MLPHRLILITVLGISVSFSSFSICSSVCEVWKVMSYLCNSFQLLLPIQHGISKILYVPTTCDDRWLSWSSYGCSRSISSFWLRVHK